MKEATRCEPCMCGASIVGFGITRYRSITVNRTVRLNGEVSYANYETREEAEEQRNKEIEYRKGQSGNIYSFELVFEGTPKGEQTSKPKLIYRDKDQASYEPK